MPYMQTPQSQLVTSDTYSMQLQMVPFNSGKVPVAYQGNQGLNHFIPDQLADWTQYTSSELTYPEYRPPLKQYSRILPATSINITELNLPQLEMLKNQLDQEVEFLSTSIAQLKVVQTKYVEAKDCLNVLNKSNEGKELLVPLTSSMYVPGKLHDVEHVLIDVGTGYYVEKTAEDAKDFFKRKIDFLTKQMEKIQPALQEKHAMKQAVMEMMSQKIQQLTALGATQATAKA